MSISKKAIIKELKQKTKVGNQEISEGFVKQVEDGSITPELAYRLLHQEKIDDFDIKLLKGEIVFKRTKIIIDRKLYESKIVLLLRYLDVDDKNIAMLTKSVLWIYANANKLLGKPLTKISSDFNECISELCLLNSDDCMNDLVEINKKPEVDEIDVWYRKGYLLFGWSESGGAFYLKIFGYNMLSIWFLDHEGREVWTEIASNIEELKTIVKLL